VCAGRQPARDWYGGKNNKLAQRSTALKWRLGKIKASQLD
jgi:hypothetical protein